MEDLSCVEIEDGTMMGLHHLELVGLRNIRAVPRGIKYIRALDQMFLIDMPTPLIESLRRSESTHIHIFETTDSEATERFHTFNNV